MYLDIINSGSDGNCYVLHNKNEALVLEAGVSIKKVVDILGGVSKIKGCLITHEHNDHAKYMEQFMKRGVQCYCTSGTSKGIIFKSKFKPNIIALKKIYKIGGFCFMPFKTFHDYPTCRALEPCGFLIKHMDTGNILFVTDTKYVENTFENLNNILIECNYKTSILKENTYNGIINKARAKRIIETHMSLETCKSTLLANDLTKVNNIILIHLSKDNADFENFRNTIALTTGKKVYCAEENLKLNFNKML